MVFVVHGNCDLCKAVMQISHPGSLNNTIMQLGFWFDRPREDPFSPLFRLASYQAQAHVEDRHGELTGVTSENDQCYNESMRMQEAVIRSSDKL